MAAQSLTARSLIAVSLFSALLCLCDAQKVRIEIKSSWGGLGTPAKATLVITGKGHRYTADGRRVDEKTIEALMDAVEQPFVKQPSLEQCGITEQWLEDNYQSALEDYTHVKARELSPKQVALFKDRFTDLTHAQTQFAELFESWHTDDYPDISVTVSTPAREFAVHSQSQYVFMLPWLARGIPGGGYNCRISQAIAALLPKGFVNRERLVLGHSLRWQLTESAMRTIETEWNLLDTEFKVGEAVAPIFAHYTPIKTAISNLSSIDLDGGQAWNAVLGSKDLPSNLTIGVSLRYSKKKLFGASQFLTQLPTYSNLVLSVPWLLKYLQAHGDVSAELRYVDGRSLSPKAHDGLTRDLREHGKSELADEVLKNGADSSFLEIASGPGCWSRVIVFPSKEVLIWHFKCDSILGFPANDLESWDYYGWRSTGTLVKPDGTLVK